jgi:ABC-type multidrug transport system fused ATPase/permease subunit
MAMEAPSLDAREPFLAKTRSTAEILRRVASYLKPYKINAAANIVFALLALGFSLVFPQITQYIIDDVIGRGSIELLLPAALALACAFLLRDLFTSLRIHANNRLEQNVIYDLRRDLYARLQLLPVGYFDRRASGDLMTRLLDDVHAVERIVIDGSEQGTSAALTILAVLVILAAKNVHLATLALIPLPLLAGGVAWYSITAVRQYRSLRQAMSMLNALLADSLQGIRQIKAFNRQPHENARFAERADAVRRRTLGVFGAWAVYSPMMSFVASLGTVLVLWRGGQLVITGEMTLGELVGFLFYLGLFYEPIGRLHGLNQMLQSSRAASERVFDILDAPVERSGRQGNARFPAPVRGDVRFENVSFDYAADRAALKNISLHARPGEKVALVGPTGSGKSTLVSLLPAFYEPTAGRITIDSVDIARIPLDLLRSQVAVVSQEAFLFNGTVRENLLYGRLEASEAEMLKASQAAA